MLLKKVRDEIVRVIEFAREGKIEEIDKLDKVLFFGFKWIIAFAYQDFNNMKIGFIFNKGVYEDIANGENLGDISVAQIHRHYLKNNETFETMLEKYEPLWDKYYYGEGQDDESAAVNPSEKQDKERTTNPTTQKIPLNQILYGPPGTGKTYATIDKALEILAEFGAISSDELNAERKAKKAIFDEFKNEGQIEFVTFHQSFSYEEFVEGIKPETSENGEIAYEVKDGIFKKICEKALVNQTKHADFLQNTKRAENDPKELFQAFAQDLQQKLNEGENIDFYSKMRVSKVSFFKNGEARSITIAVPDSSSG